MSRSSSLLLAASLAASLSFAVTYTPVDYPGASQTFLTGINHFGLMTGYYSLPNLTFHSFLYQNGAFTSIPDFPGSTSTYVLGLNNDSLAVGHWTNNSSEGNFIYNLTTKTWTNVKVGNSSAGIFYGIDGYGETTGQAVVGGVSFAFDGFGNDYRLLKFPGATATVGFGISGAAGNSTRIVGEYLDSSSNFHGFLWVFGGFMGIDFPGSTSTVASGIYAARTNQSIQIVGTYTNANTPMPGSGEALEPGTDNTEAGIANLVISPVTHGFLLSSLATWTSFDYPGITSATNPLSINDAGAIVGFYTAGGLTHGFVRLP